MATLTITAGPSAQIGTQFLLKQRPLAGGRHPQQEIQLLDPEVSRRHFLVRAEGDAHIIAETNSANGVFVNGAKISSHTLQEGDQITVGKTVLVYSRQEASPQGDAVQAQRRAERQFRESGTFLAQRPPSQ